MRYRKKWAFFGVLVLLILFIKWYTANAARVEYGYAAGFYPPMARFLRLLFGWLPFSVGDVLYGLAVLWVLINVVKGIKLLFKKQATWRGIGIKSIKAAIILMLIYVVFYGFWGINYNRKGIAHQMGLQIDTVSYNDLKQTTALLIEKLNVCKQHLIETNTPYPSNSQLFKKVQVAYNAAQNQLPFLAYKTTSLKSSLWGWLGNYTGFTGYYNPFTGEAQVNTTVPKFLQPFVACHEVAHQLGYAKENEANSVGYIAALHSGDTLLLYSTYFDLYNYTSRALYFEAMMQTDTMLIKDFSNRLLPQVKNDFKEMRAFNNRHRNPLEPVVRKGYNFYLKNNNQPLGIKSYDAVTTFLIAYYKKFGKI